MGIRHIVLATGMMVASFAAGRQGKAPGTSAPQGTATQQSGAFKTQKEKVSYAIGMNAGNSLRRQSIDVDLDVLIQGLKDALSGGKTKLTEAEVSAALAELQKELRARQEEKLRVAAETNKKEGAAFLAANKVKEGVVTRPSGLQYKILKQGTGPKPTATDTVVCNYRGTLVNGTEFDSSYKRNEPATFPVVGVIKGWTEALQLMPVGSKWQLFIPPDLAYGPNPRGEILGPNATLIFEVELLSIEEKLKPTAEKPKP